MEREAGFIQHFADSCLLVITIAHKPAVLAVLPFLRRVLAYKGLLRVHDVAQMDDEFRTLFFGGVQNDLHARYGVMHNVYMQVGEYQKFCFHLGYSFQSMVIRREMFWLCVPVTYCITPFGRALS